MSVPDFFCILDPGHGGTRVQDPFRVSKRYHIYEGDLNLNVAYQVMELLKADPRIDVVLTRSKDEQVSLEDRLAYAKENQADCFVSIHHNFTSFQTSGMHHPLVFVHQPYRDLPHVTRTLGLDLLKGFQRTLSPLCPHDLPNSYPNSGLVADQWIFPEGMYLLRNLYTFCPAVITESFFVSDDAFEELAWEGSILKAEASAIAHAIFQLFQDVSWKAHLQWEPIEVDLKSEDELCLTGRIHFNDVKGVSRVQDNFQVTCFGAKAPCEVAHDADSMFFVAYVPVSEFVKLQSIVCRANSGKGLLYPDRMHVVFPNLRPKMPWSMIWTTKVHKAVMGKAKGRATQELLDRVKISLRLFPNHPCRLEAMAFLAEQAGSNGGTIEATRWLTFLSREMALFGNKTDAKSWHKRLNTLRKSLTR